jgi:hypothetical protein
MLKIFINDKDITSGSIPLSWCLDEEAINYYLEKKCPNPYIVICVIPVGSSSSKEKRFIAPIKDLIMYIPFSTKGKNKIFALVCSSKSQAQSLIRRSSYDEFYMESIAYIADDGSFGYNSYITESFLNSAESLEVEVPAECFAPEPPEWEQAWVNNWFQYKPKDQCEYRRRRIFAYTFQPIAFIINMLLRIIFTIIALFFGCRNTTLQPLLHQLSNDLETAFMIMTGGTIFIGRGKSTFKNYIRLLCAPFVVLPVVGFIIGCAMGIIPIMKVLAIFTGVIMVVFIPFLIVFGTSFVRFINDYLDMKANQMEANEYWYMNKDNMDLILCNGKDKPTKLKDIPKKNRTLKLKFFDLKSKVCRPFSR